MAQISVEEFIGAGADKPVMSPDEFIGAGQPKPQRLSETLGAGEGYDRLRGMGKEAAVRGLTNVVGLPVALWNLGQAGSNAFDRGMNAIWPWRSADAPTLDRQPVETMSPQWLQQKAADVGALNRPQYQPETPGEKIYASGVEGAFGSLPFGAAGMIAGGGGGAAGEFTAQLFPDHPVAARLGGGLVGAVGTGMVVNALSKTLQSLWGTPKGILDDYAQEAVTARSAADLGGPGAKMTQNALARMPGGTDRIQSSSQQTIDELAGAVERRAAQIGGGTNPSQAGEALQGGFRNWIDRFRAQSSDAWGKFWSQIPDDATSNMPKTRGLLSMSDSALRKELPDLAKALEDPTLGKIAASVRAPTVTNVIEPERYILNPAGAFMDPVTVPAVTAPSTQLQPVSMGAIKEFRTAIGQKLENAALVGDTDTAGLKRLYSALTDDIEGLAKTAGGNNAVTSFRDAAAITKAGHNNLETLVAPALKPGVTPEAAFNLAMNQASSGGTKLYNMRALVTPEEWGTLSSTVLRRMGQATPGAQGAAGDTFSPATFLTNWNKLSDGAKSSLFRGTENAELAPALDRLARIAETMKSTTRLANTSNTAGTSMFMNLLSLTGGGGGAYAGNLLGGGAGAAAGAAAGMAAPVVAANVSARLMTSPAFVRWLATPVGEMGIDRHVAALSSIAAAHPKIAGDIQSFLAALPKAGNE